MTTPSPKHMRRLLAYLRPHRAVFVLALICMVLFGMTDGGIPFLVKEVLDGVFASQDRSFLYLLPALLVGFAFFRAITDFGQQYLMAKVGHLIVRDIRNAINLHVLRLPPGYFIQQSSANLLAHVTSDVLLVRTLLTETLAAVIRDTIRIVVLIGSAIYLDPLLALISLVAFPIGVYPVVRFGKRMRKLSRQGQDAIGAVSNMLQESILGNRIVKIFTREEFEDSRFRTGNDQLTRTFVRSERVRAITGPINEVMASVAIAGVLLYGGLSVINGVRTQGDFLAFLISVFLLYDPFKKLSRVHNNVQQGLAGAERIFELLDAVPAVQDPVSPRVLGVENTVRFEHVSFRYSEGGPLVLDDISLELREGECVALVGFSGSGKSTLADLVPRFMDPTSGVITIGGVDIREASLRELRRRIAVVGQHTFLFNDTVYNNIAYGAEGASPADIERVAKAAFAFEFIQRLPQGFETRVGEGGYALSGGERQRISIARALLKNAPILILDEATASLDNRSEREVQGALDALAAQRTTLVIAHRLSTIRHADRIVVMRAGAIVEVGNHDQLLSQDGEYAKLFHLQFSSHDGDARASRAGVVKHVVEEGG